MVLDIYLVRDRDFNTVGTFTSMHRAVNFSSYNKYTDIEHIKVDVADAATREVHHVNLKAENAPAIKTMKQLTEAHITYVVYDVCKGVVAKAARILDMSPTNLVHKLKQMGLK